MRWHDKLAFITVTHIFFFLTNIFVKPTIMCGLDNSNRPRGGALAALNPPINTATSKLCADLAFHTPGCPANSSATHARLTPSDECDIKNLSNLHVVIQ